MKLPSEFQLKVDTKGMSGRQLGTLMRSIDKYFKEISFGYSTSSYSTSRARSSNKYSITIEKKEWYDILLINFKRREGSRTRGAHAGS